MKTSDLFLYLALSSKIVQTEANGNLCGNPYCNPQCLEYENIKLFSKFWNIEFIYSNDIICITSNSIKLTEITLRISEIELYINNIKFLR